jgi:hypothetical protein
MGSDFEKEQDQKNVRIKSQYGTKVKGISTVGLVSAVRSGRPRRVA